MNNQTLKIGITCYPSTGGSGIVATELGHELAKRGHEVHFISYGIPFRLNIESPNIFFHEVQVNDYELFKYPDYTLPLAVKMADVSKKHQLDILHVHYAVPHATAAYLAKQMIGCAKSKPAVVTTLHGTDITLMSKDPHYQPIIQYSIENSCGVTAVSQSLIDDTRKTFDLQRDIRLIHNFYTPKKVSVPRDKLRKSLNISPDETVFIHLSNARPVKRVDDILKAYALSGVANKSKLLMLVGGQFTPFEALAQELGIEKNIIVKEHIREVQDYIEAADVGIYASENESFGLGILECMAHQKPVIATKAGGIPEVIEDNATGLLAAVGDTSTIAQHIKTLCENTPLRTEMGIKAQQRAQKYFSTDYIIDQYISYYQYICKHCIDHKNPSIS